MDAFYICWTAILRESEKYRTFIWNTARKGFGAQQDHRIPVNRLEYVYLRGPLVINSIQNCVLHSITERTLPILYSLADKDNCNICCISRGPGLEVVGFLMGFRKHIHDFKSVSVTVINPFNEWRDFSESLICENQYHPTNSAFDYYSPNSFDFISSDLKILSFPARKCIQEADVIIMHKCCSSGDSHVLMMKDITALMKKSAVLFSINSDSKNKIFSSLQNIGTSLCSPLKFKLQNLPYDAKLASFVGLPPKTKGSSNLVVWQKRASTKTAVAECKNDIQSQGVDSLVAEPSCSGSPMSLLAQNPDLNVLSFSNSNEPFPEPKSNSEIVENTNHESNSSDLKEDISRSISEVFSEATAVKCLESTVVSESKSNSEIFENTNHESNSSDLKEDISSNIFEISLEATAVKSLEGTLLSGIGASSECDVDSNNLPQSDEGCEISPIFDSSESEGSNINALLEHCEKMVDCLEKKIEDLAMLHSCKNLCDNCCAHNSNYICHISRLAFYHKCDHFNASIPNCCHCSSCCSHG